MGIVMNILFIFTGGTIGSTARNGYIGIDGKKPYRLIEAYKEKYGIGFDYDIREPYTILSENSTGETITALIGCIRESIDRKYDGIVIMHGTDTLQYTAAALGYAFGNNGIPICLVSSNHPVEDERANGLVNLRAAAGLIEENTVTAKHKGVFVPYKNPWDKYISVHRGTRLLSSQAFSDSFHSIKNSIYGSINETGAFTGNPFYSEYEDGIEPLSGVTLTENCRNIFRIVPNPGMVYPQIGSEIKYIIHESYHSGTINTISKENRNFFEEMKRRGVKVFLTGLSDDIPYESTGYYEELGINPVKNISPIALYMKLWLFSSAGLDAEKNVYENLGGDFCDIINMYS